MWERSFYPIYQVKRFILENNSKVIKQKGEKK